MQRYDGKTIMILGAGQLQIPLIKRAKEKGLKVIVVSPKKDEPGIPYADALVSLDVKDERNILAAAQEYNIDGITTDQTDMPTRTAAYVAEKMGLPGIGYEMGCLFTDKYKQREKCKQLGIPVPEYALVHSVAEVKAFFAQHGAIIIKPIDSQASHGVAKITHHSLIEDAFEAACSYSRAGDVLVEQWIDGDEFPADSYVINGKCTLLSIGQYHPFSIENVFSSYNTVWPANQPEEVLNMIRDTNQKVVEGFGLPIGRTHGEYIVSNGNCYLVEIGARGGGSFFSSDNIRYTSGLCSEDFLIDVALGLPMDSPPQSEERHFCCSTLFFYLPEGIVETIAGIDEVLNLPYVRRNNLYHIKPGMKTQPVIDKGARYFMTVTAASYEELEERIDIIRDRLQIITITHGNQRQLPIWK